MFGSRGYPVKDLTEGVKTEDGFRIGKFDFPCITTTDVDKYTECVVLNRMEDPRHKYHGWLIIAPIVNTVLRHNTLLSQNNEEVYSMGDADYVFKKTLIVFCDNQATVRFVEFEKKAYLPNATWFKVTKKIDDEAETTFYEDTDVTEESYAEGIDGKACNFTGVIVVFRVYLKGYGGSSNKSYNRLLRAFVTIKEESSTAFTVNKPELI